MNKKNLAVVMLLTLPLLVGCRKGASTKTLTFTAPDDWQIQRKDSIVSIGFSDVPTDAIEVGYFSQAGIKLHVKYTEGDEVDYPFDESFFPLDIVGTLKTAGKKAYDILFKENHIPLNFTQKKTAQARSIKVTYLDHSGAELAHTYVNYLEDANYSGGDVASYEETKGVHYWDGNFTGRTQKVYKDEVVYASYQFRPYTYSLNDEAGWKPGYEMPIAVNTSSGTTHTLTFYFGRMYRCVLDGSDFVYHYQNFYDQCVYNPTNNPNPDIASMIDGLLGVFANGRYSRNTSGPETFNGSNNKTYTLVNLDKFDFSPNNVASFKGTAFPADPTPVSVTSGGKSSIRVLYADENINALKEMAKARTLGAVYQEYKTGYYRHELVVDADIYLSVDFGINNPSQTSYTYTFSSVKVIPCMLTDSARFETTYYETNEPKWSYKSMVLDNINVWQTIWRLYQ